MMTMAADAFVRPCSAAQSTTNPCTPALFTATALLVGLVFFAAGHDLLISRAVAYTQTADEMQAAALGGNMARRVAFFALAGWGLLLLANGKQRIKLDSMLVGSVSALSALAAASVLWTDEPAMCLRRLLVLFCCFAAAGGVARAFSLREIGWLIVLVIGSLATIGLATEILLGTFRPWTGDYRFAGTVHPNTQGPALAILCLAAIALAKDSGRYRPLLWFAFAAGIVLLLLTKSRTAVAALFAALAACQMIKLRPRALVVTGVATAWLVSAGLCGLWLCGIDPVTDGRDLVLLGRSSESESLSGRALIWPEVVRYARERFWLGYGYEAFWTPGHIEAISDELEWGLREAHNGYLEMWLWLGVVGVALLLFVAAAAIVAALRGFRVTNNAAYLLPLGLLVFGLLNSCLESGVVVVSLVPFLAGCCIMRLTLFQESLDSISGIKTLSGVSGTETELRFTESTFAPA
jgi:exopolysaccharide production protein ExoQ